MWNRPQSQIHSQRVSIPPQLVTLYTVYIQQHNKTQRYLKKWGTDSVIARVWFDCSQLEPLSRCDCRAALYDRGTVGYISFYRITVTNVSLQRIVSWPQYLCAILTLNKRANHFEQCKSMWFYPLTSNLIELNNWWPQTSFRLSPSSFPSQRRQFHQCQLSVFSLLGPNPLFVTVIMFVFPI